MSTLLATNVAENVNISTLTEVINFQYIDPNPTLVVVKIVVSGLVGNGYYLSRIFINGIEILPEFPIALAAGVTTFIAQSRSDLLVEDDIVSIKIIGQPQDISVKCVSYIVDINSGITHSDIKQIIDAMAASLNNLTLNPERAVLAAQPKNATKERIILSPIKPCVKTFTLPK